MVRNLRLLHQPRLRRNHLSSITREHFYWPAVVDVSFSVVTEAGVEGRKAQVEIAPLLTLVFILLILINITYDSKPQELILQLGHSLEAGLAPFRVWKNIFNRPILIGSLARSATNLTALFNMDRTTLGAGA